MRRRGKSQMEVLRIEKSAKTCYTKTDKNWEDG